MNKDKLNSANAYQAMTAAFAAISTLQDFPAHLQVAGASILINEMAKILNLSVSELLNKAERMAGDMNEQYKPEILALRQYILMELSK